MCPGLSSDSQAIDDARKTAVINKELARLNIDVACLQETRLPDSGSLRETDYTFFWKGLSQDKPRQHGVGFAVRNSLLAFIETPTGGSSRLLILRMKIDRSIDRCVQHGPGFPDLAGRGANPYRSRIHLLKLLLLYIVFCSCSVSIPVAFFIFVQKFISPPR